MKRTLYDVTVEELEWLREFEMKGSPPFRKVRRVANNFVSRMMMYEKEHEAELVQLYVDDYKDILDEISLSQNPEKMVEWIINYDWDNKTFVMVMGNQLVNTWGDILMPMTPEYMRASLQAVIDYVRIGIAEELMKSPPVPKYGLNLGQALAISNATGILLSAIEIAIERKKKDTV